jgi:hypothetical protein
MEKKTGRKDVARVATTAKGGLRFHKCNRAGLAEKRSCPQELRAANECRNSLGV